MVNKCTNKLIITSIIDGIIIECKTASPSNLLFSSTFSCIYSGVLSKRFTHKCKNRYLPHDVHFHTQGRYLLMSTLKRSNLNPSDFCQKVYWYTIRSTVQSIQSINAYLDSLNIHYIFVQGFSKHHIFISEKKKRFFKNKKPKRTITYY